MQSLNALSPILRTLLGISILFKFVQFLNTEPPILVTLFGISILVKLVQPLNAEEPILLPPVIITFFSDVGTYLLSVPKIYPKRVSSLPLPIKGNVILVKPVQL